MNLASVRHALVWALARAGVRSERGATAVEYGIMLFLIAATIILAVVLLGERTSATFSCTAHAVSVKAGVAGCS